MLPNNITDREFRKFIESSVRENGTSVEVYQSGRGLSLSGIIESVICCQLGTSTLSKITKEDYLNGDLLTLFDGASVIKYIYWNKVDNEIEFLETLELASILLENGDFLLQENGDKINL